MSSDEPLYRAVHPKGTHLASSRNTDGAFRGTYLDDETNQISGQAEFVEVEQDDDEQDDDEQDDDEQDDDEQVENASDALAQIIVLAAGLALGVVATKAAPKVKSWWQDNAYPSLRSRFSSLLPKKTEKDADVQIEPLGRPEISLEGVSTETFSAEVTAALADTRAVMSSEEAQRRFIAMILAAAVAAEQFRSLKEAHIEGGEKELQEFKKTLANISTEPVVDPINKMLETNDGLNEDAGPILVKFLGGGGRVDGEYVPLQLEQLQAAVRLP